MDHFPDQNHGQEELFSDICAHSLSYDGENERGLAPSKLSSNHTESGRVCADDHVSVESQLRVCGVAWSRQNFVFSQTPSKYGYRVKTALFNPPADPLRSRRLMGYAYISFDLVLVFVAETVRYFNL